MTCPHCGKANYSTVLNSRAWRKHEIYRRRKCLACGKRFSTTERVELKPRARLKADESGGMRSLFRTRDWQAIRKVAKALLADTQLDHLDRRDLLRLQRAAKHLLLSKGGGGRRRKPQSSSYHNIL